MAPGRENEMGTTNAKMIETTCYKCLGARTFPCWSHINNGVCFTCGGAGTLQVSEETLARWQAQASAREADLVARLGKRITLPVLGHCHVRRTSSTGFVVTTIDSVAGELATEFAVVAGQVELLGACNGHLSQHGGPRKGLKSLRAELQAALKLPAPVEQAA